MLAYIHVVMEKIADFLIAGLHGVLYVFHLIATDPLWMAGAIFVGLLFLVFLYLKGRSSN